MAIKVRTLDFLPEIFRTDTNQQFLSSTLDQLVQQPKFKKIQGYIGSKFGYGVNAGDGYVAEPNKIRTDYQLEPAVVFKKNETNIPVDAVTYPNLLDALRSEGALVDNHSNLFSNEFYSWDSFVDLDKIINYSQYYWLPQGPDSVLVTPNNIFNQATIYVKNTNNLFYNFTSELLDFPTSNPTITLVRGGSYEFRVEQNSKFYIQTEPGITGYQELHKNFSTREIYGLEFNGVNYGGMKFNVPLSSAQDGLNYPLGLTVDLASDKQINEVHGARLSDLKNIDGVYNLNNKTIIFTSHTPSDSAFLATLYGEQGFDSDIPGSVVPIQFKITKTNASTNIIECVSTKGLTVNSVINFVGVEFGNLQERTDYYITSIIDDVKFTVSETINGTNIVLQTATPNINGDLIGIANNGGFEEGKYTTVNNYVYRIKITDDVEPIILLVEDDVIPNDQRIQISSGDVYSLRGFVRNVFGEISLIPLITANYATLYYQDSENPDQYGKIVFIDAIDQMTIDVDSEIVGAKSYTSPNGVKFTNGLKVTFYGSIFPETYKQDQYYVEGVGTSIELIPVSEQSVPEPFGEGFFAPFDNTDYDIDAFGSSLLVPYNPDYITIKRNSIGKNAWSRSNRWFHIEVLNYTLEKNPESAFVQAALKDANKYRAKRPIIEYYPNLKLYNSGTTGKAPVDYIDFYTKNIFAGGKTSTTFQPDGQFSLLSDGSRVIFAGDTDVNVRNKIFVANVSKKESTGEATVSLTKASDGDIYYNDQVVVLQGETYHGLSFYFDGEHWKQAQYKQFINQYPKFDVFDSNDISFSNKEYYPGSDFEGSTLFEYTKGSGVADSVLGIPVKYSSLTNIGDINFTVSLNTQSFNYVYQSKSINTKINTGYVFSYKNRTDYVRKIGWERSIAPSFQYQVFNSKYLGQPLVCDVPIVEQKANDWQNLVVYVGNQRTTDYTYQVVGDNTIITLTSPNLTIGEKVEIMVKSDKVSYDGYYQIPYNFDHNPFNVPLDTINLGDLRGQYKSICNNVSGLVGASFGANNYRDLGDVVPFGNRIIQNSAGLVAPALFARNTDENFFNALQFNSNQYIKFKATLLDVVHKTDYNMLQNDSDILDDALAQISTTANSNSSFFWSDMLPTVGDYTRKSYTFKVGIDSTYFPLKRVYDTKNANYNCVLVYITRVYKKGYNRTVQLIKDVDYTISETEKFVYVTTDLLKDDVITVKEYTQTYGSYVPNTPTKLGLYPKFIPQVVYDESFSIPTYFIRGHDGSYSKIYGEYVDGFLTDFRDRALLEFEKRIYNNIKVDAKLPLELDDICPGQFRKTNYSFNEFYQMYSSQFLNWVGLNRVDYISQRFDSVNSYSWNYNRALNKLNNQPIQQGNWRGIYLWLYDTCYPDSRPWEMLGLVDKPTWWEKRYGVTPYTSDNTLLWTDISNGYVYNDGAEYVNEKRIRPELFKILPVDSIGKLKNPFDTIVSNYDVQEFKREWTTGDMGPVEFGYRTSSTWPFDLIRLFALAKPAVFFTLGIDLDRYKYNAEFKQYLVNNRFRESLSNVKVYGTDDISITHGYLNWIVDYLTQFGINGSEKITTLLKNVDVNLAYRLSGFSDKKMLQFFAEKGSPNSKNNSLLIPDDSYHVLLFQNQPYDIIVYSSVIIQSTPSGYRVYGNSQDKAYFVVFDLDVNGFYDTINVDKTEVVVPKYAKTTTKIVPYGTEFLSIQKLCEFIKAYGLYLQEQNIQFNNIENAIELNWNQMIAEILYWYNTGWEVGSTVNVNPSASTLTITTEYGIIQPLTLQQQNFILNQNLVPIKLTDLSVKRLGNTFSVTALNAGDAIAYFKSKVASIEHLVVFDNSTVFNDVLFNQVTGLRQQRLYVKGSKTAEWSGTVNAAGFLISQDNIQQWQENKKYSKGTVVLYKNNYWVADTVNITPSATFDTNKWRKTPYEDIQLGMLPNLATKAYEATLYYDTNRANLKNDADLLAFSLIGYRPKNYFTESNIDDIAQINLYKSLLQTKGTLNAFGVLEGSEIQKTQLEYDFHDNWAIKVAEFGGVFNKNFIEITLDKNKLSGNPAIIGIIDNIEIPELEQVVAINELKNYNFSISDINILPTIASTSESKLPSAGYVNIEDVRYTTYYFNGLNNTSISDLYKTDYIWIADRKGEWGVYTPISQKIFLSNVLNNLNNTATFFFSGHHKLEKDSLFAIINFDSRINGYYSVDTVLNLTSIVVSKTLDPTTTKLNGNGLVLRLQNQRVERAKDIYKLPLVEFEYSKSKVWVDNNTVGEWTVYQRTNNYQLTVLPKVGLTTHEFGRTVAYIDQINSYLVADPYLGKLYRYKIVIDGTGRKQHLLVDTIVKTQFFGTAIVKNKDFIVVSQPDPFGDLSQFVIYRTIKNEKIEGFVEEQTLSIAGFRAGDAMAISGDSNFLFFSLIELNAIIAMQLDQNLAYYDIGIRTAAEIQPGATAFTVYGDITSNPGRRFSFTNYGFENVYTLVTSIYDQPNNITTINVYEPITQTIGALVPLYVALSNYSLLGALTSEGLATGTDQFSYSLATNYDGSMLFVGSPQSDFNSNWGLVDSGYAFVFDRLVENFEVTGDTPPFAISLFILPWYATRQSLVFVNDIRVDPSFYVLFPNDVNSDGIPDSTVLVIGLNLLAGDIITVSSGNFVLTQEVASYDVLNDIKPGQKFGYSLDCNVSGSELIVGSPWDLQTSDNEGSVYRYTSEGKRTGRITGILPCSLIQPVSILVNGYRVALPEASSGTPGDALYVARKINEAVVNNVFAYATQDNRLVIRLRDQNLNPVNNKLNLTVFDGNVLTQLGIVHYIKSQVLHDPHVYSRTQYGYKVKFNEKNSFVVTAPATNRHMPTLFDFSNDDDNHNDTVFDNNFTVWEDIYENAGSAYMYDYIESYGESLESLGNYVYAQSLYDTDFNYGVQPLYGTGLDFSYDHVIIGDADFKPGYIGGNGRVVVYENKKKDTNNWSVYRESSKIIDIDKIQKIQLYNNENNNNIASLDYFDPLQGKLLGPVRENLDFISSTDPAGYSNIDVFKGNLVWGNRQVGMMWFDISSTKFLNYHQNDLIYNSKYWGNVFPGSTPLVYTWVESDVQPAFYTGLGTPYDFTKFSVSYEIDSSGNLVTTYFYWVRKTNKLYPNKTLTDAMIELYVANPQNSGIPYFSAYAPNVFGLYNAGDFVQGKQTNLHIGYSVSNSDTPTHTEFQLIRSNFPDDFLSGFPDQTLKTQPAGLYNKMLYSFAGVDDFGGILPNPLLPQLLQTGVSNRPNQGFFIDRFTALKNYLLYANRVLKEYPISELYSINLLETYDQVNYTYDTRKYWEYIYWWDTGYNDNTKTTREVPKYYDLERIVNAVEGQIVGVIQNSQGNREVYIYTNNNWKRIGLQNGTIRFLSTLWDYVGNAIGFGDNFFDTVEFDSYPSTETRNIIRALNEQIYTGPLFSHRNKSLILIFEYIQSENIERGNYMPWLNKTSFADVSYKVRELILIEKYQNDILNLLEGYLNEVKPYHVVLKEFTFKYPGQDTFNGLLTDFDLPPTFDKTVNRFVTPKISFGSNPTPDEVSLTDKIWNRNTDYKTWITNLGLTIGSRPRQQIALLSKFFSKASNEIFVDNASGIPVAGIITIGNEIISYTQVNRITGVLYGLTRGIGSTNVEDHYDEESVYMDLPSIIVLDGARGYAQAPIVTAVIDTSKYPTPVRPAKLKSVMVGDKVVGVEVLDPGEGYVIPPDIVFESSAEVSFNEKEMNFISSILRLNTLELKDRDLIKLDSNNNLITGYEAIAPGYYYIKILGTTRSLNTQIIVSLHTTYRECVSGDHKVIFKANRFDDSLSYTIKLVPKTVVVTKMATVRSITTNIKFDRIGYTSSIKAWTPGTYWPIPYASIGKDASIPATLTSTKEYENPPAIIVSETGLGASYKILNEISSVTYYVRFSNYGDGYRVGDNITVLGRNLDGVTGINDVVITITDVTYTNGLPVGPIKTFTFTGDAPLLTKISSQDAILTVTAVEEDNRDGGAIASFDFDAANMTPNQIVGMKIYMYRLATPYTYTDSGLSFTGSITGTLLTITSYPGSQADLKLYDKIYGVGIPANTIINKFITGLGKEGTYQISTSSTFFIGYIDGTVLNISYIFGELGIDIGQPIIGNGVAPGTIITAALPNDNVLLEGKYRINISQTVNSGIITTSIVNKAMKTGGGAVIKIYSPNFTTNSTTQSYAIKVLNPGAGYRIGDVIRVSGSVLGGVDTVNDVRIVVLSVNILGALIVTRIFGTSPIPVTHYGVLPISDTQIKLYTDAQLRYVVPWDSFPFKNHSNFVGKDFAYVPAPFSTNGGIEYQPNAIVTYGGKVWKSFISNHDSVFDPTKWQEIQAAERYLNANDRISSTYKPTLDMPGKDPALLMDGITYPNNVYAGNKFAPDEELPLDFEIRSQKFYPRDINLKAIIFDGRRYLAVGDSATHSVLLTSTNGEDWDTINLAETVLGVTDIVYSGVFYVITTTNIYTPILLSTDAIKWLTVGQDTSFDILPFEDSTFDSFTVNADKTYINAIIYENNKFFAAGESIITSTDVINWNTVYAFRKTLKNELRHIHYIQTENYIGYLAVGNGFTIVGQNDTAAPDITYTGKILHSIDGVNWVIDNNDFSVNSLNTIVSNNEIIVIAGDNGEVWSSINSYNWSQINLPLTVNFRDSAYGKSMFVVVGDSGTIIKSSDGVTWQQVTSFLPNTNFNGITFDGTYFYVVGDNGLILRSSNGIVWENLSFITSNEPDFVIKGSDFLFGYGPEELVPGSFRDNLVMKVNTMPGSWWDIETITQSRIYGYTGFTMVSKLFKPDGLVVSFEGISQIPSLMNVFVLNQATGQGTRVYETDTLEGGFSRDKPGNTVDGGFSPNTSNFTVDGGPGPDPEIQLVQAFTVDWVKKTITLTHEIEFDQILMIEVYEIGNGRQLIRNSSDNIPLKVDEVTRNSIIELDFEYQVLEDSLIYYNGIKLKENIDYTIVTTSKNYLAILFSTLYDTTTDYISFVLFSTGTGSTLGFSNKISYSIPDTQVYEYKETNIFDLDEYQSRTDNVNNMIVELNGKRLTPEVDYTIETITAKQITIIPQLKKSDLLAFTTFHETKRQYLNTVVVTDMVSTPISYIDSDKSPNEVLTQLQLNVVDNDIVIIDGVIGSTGVNGQSFYIKINGTKTVGSDTYYSYQLYLDLAPNNIPNRPLLETGSYISGGYIMKKSLLIDIPIPEATLSSSNTTISIIPSDPSRAWVTINGIRLDTRRQLFYFDRDINNNITAVKMNLLTTISDSDTVIVTTMISNATPNEYSYVMTVDKNNKTNFYMTGNSNRTWLVRDFALFDDTIYVKDVSKLIHGDTNIVQLNSEHIRFIHLDYQNNTISGLTRGINGTGILELHKEYDYINGISAEVTMPDKMAAKSWTSIVSGEPLSIAQNEVAKFLKIRS